MVDNLLNMYSEEGLVVQSVGGDNLLFMNTLNYFAYTHTSHPEYLFSSLINLNIHFRLFFACAIILGTVLNTSVTELEGNSL